MSTEVWGLLPKSQIDNETIEEAIDRLIENHNDNVDAHLEADQSLQSHKASEIIDHAALSIVEDKLADMCVSSDKLKYDRLTIETIWESLDAIGQYVTGSGAIEQYLASLRLTTGATNNSISAVSADAWTEGYGVNFFKDPRFLAVVLLTQTTNQTIYIVAGSFDLNCFGFKISNGTLYALHMKDNVEYTTDISSGITLTGFRRYKAIYTSGSKIEFYIDDILKATHTTNLPENGADAATEIGYFRLQIKTTASANKELHSRYLVLTQET